MNAKYTCQMVANALCSDQKYAGIIVSKEVIKVKIFNYNIHTFIVSS
jgi:hypothetical protein